MERTIHWSITASIHIYKWWFLTLEERNPIQGIKMSHAYMEWRKMAASRREASAWTPGCWSCFPQETTCWSNSFSFPRATAPPSVTTTKSMSVREMFHRGQGRSSRHLTHFDRGWRDGASRAAWRWRERPGCPSEEAGLEEVHSPTASSCFLWGLPDSYHGNEKRLELALKLHKSCH